MLDFQAILFLVGSLFLDPSTFPQSEPCCPAGSLSPYRVESCYWVSVYHDFDPLWVGDWLNQVLVPHILACCTFPVTGYVLKGEKSAPSSLQHHIVALRSSPFPHLLGEVWMHHWMLGIQALTCLPRSRNPLTNPYKLRRQTLDWGVSEVKIQKPLPGWALLSWTNKNGFQWFLSPPRPPKHIGVDLPEVPPPLSSLPCLGWSLIQGPKYCNKDTLGPFHESDLYSFSVGHANFPCPPFPHTQHTCR